jgi:hypothetical protein
MNQTASETPRTERRYNVTVKHWRLIGSVLSASVVVYDHATGSRRVLLARVRSTYQHVLVDVVYGPSHVLDATIARDEGLNVPLTQIERAIQDAFNELGQADL